MRIGHDVLVVAAMEEPVPAGCIVIRETADVKAIEYQYHGVHVLGVHLRREDVEDIYAFFAPRWEPEFTELLKAVEWHDPDQLILNGINTVSGLSLINAVKTVNPDCRIQVINHTPFHCPKADMLNSFTQTRCEENISPRTCSRCLYRSKIKGSKLTVHLLESLGNNLLGKFSSRTALHTRSLIHSRMASLRRISVASEHTIVFSEEMKTFLTKQDFLSGTSIEMVRHGIDRQMFYTRGARQTSESIFLYAGRFEEVKGVFTLAEAWKSMPEKEDRHLFMAGNWAGTGIGNRVKEMLAGRKDITWLGPLGQDELADLYRKVHCLLIPSEWVETGPMVFHEAISCGCNVISSDMGGQGELAGVYKEASHVFKSGDAESLARVIESFVFRIVDEKLKDKIMSWEAHFEKLIELFNQPRNKN